MICQAGRWYACYDDGGEKWMTRIAVWRESQDGVVVGLVWEDGAHLESAENDWFTGYVHHTDLIKVHIPEPEQLVAP